MASHRQVHGGNDWSPSHGCHSTSVPTQADFGDEFDLFNLEDFPTDHQVLDTLQELDLLEAARGIDAVAAVDAALHFLEAQDSPPFPARTLAASAGEDDFGDLVSWSPHPDSNVENQGRRQSSASSDFPPLSIESFSGSSLSNSYDHVPEFQLGTVSNDSTTDLVVFTGGASPPLPPRQRPPLSGQPLVDKSGVTKQPKPSEAKRKRRTYLAEELLKVQNVKKESACIRCQILKEACGPGLPCPRCQEVMDTATIWRSPCYKARLSDAIIFCNQDIEFLDGTRHITEWTSSRKYKIKLYHNGPATHVNHPPETRPQIELVVQGFTPRPEDILRKQYFRGNELVVLDLPPFAIPQNQKRKCFRSIEACFAKNWDRMINDFHLFQDDLVISALAESKRLQNQSSLIKSALSVCAVTAFITRSFKLFGTETLGINPISDPESMYYGQIPIPNFLDVQIDELWQKLLAKICKPFLSQLKAKMKGRKKEHWFEVYLCLILILANLETFYSSYVTLRGRYYHDRTIPFRLRTTFQRWEHSADTILAHFQAVFNGTTPFFLELSDEELRTEAKMDAESIAFLRRTQAIVRAREDELREKRHSDHPGSPLSWISGLFLPT